MSCQFHATPLTVARRLQSMRGVDSCLQLHNCYENGDYLCLNVSFFAGTTMEQYIDSNAPLSECGEAKPLFRQLVECVKSVHQRGWGHHDLSLTNLIVTPDVRVKLIDFGFAVPVEQVCTEFGHTPYFAAPEVLLRQPHEAMPVDCFSLGVILFNLLHHGEMPFPANTFRELKLMVINQNPVSFQAHTSDEARSLINGLLRLEPHERFTVAQITQHKWMKQ